MSISNDLLSDDSLSLLPWLLESDVLFFPVSDVTETVSMAVVGAGAGASVCGLASRSEAVRSGSSTWQRSKKSRSVLVSTAEICVDSRSTSTAGPEGGKGRGRSSEGESEDEEVPSPQDSVPLRELLGCEAREGETETAEGGREGEENQRYECDTTNAIPRLTDSEL